MTNLFSWSKKSNLKQLLPIKFHWQLLLTITITYISFFFSRNNWRSRSVLLFWQNTITQNKLIFPLAVKYLAYNYILSKKVLSDLRSHAVLHSKSFLTCYSGISRYFIVRHLGRTFAIGKKRSQKVKFSLAMFSKLLSRDAGQKVTRGVDSHRYTLFSFFFLNFDAEKNPSNPIA